MRASLRAIAVGSLAVGVAIGGAAASLLTARNSTNSALPSQSIDEAPVASTAYDGRRAAQLVVSLSDGPSLRLDATGVVSASSCVDTTPVVSGTALFAVDGVPVLALATSTPLWRDLRIGTSGADVVALQVELLRLGLMVEVSGVFDRPTLAAVNGIGASIGWSRVTTLAASSVMWLPAPSVMVDACLVVVGSRVQAGDEVARGASVVTTADLLSSGVPEALASARWRFTSTEASVPLVDGRVVVDDIAPEWLHREADAQGRVQIDGFLVLEEPMQLWSVPPAAIDVDPTSEGQGCVAGADGASYRVTVIDSELGRSLVRFEGGTPDSVVVGSGGCAAR